MNTPQNRKKASPGLTQPANKPVRTENDNTCPLKPEMELKRLVQELEVYQLELEMQNEELRQAQVALETSRNAYAELYDFAPAGYFSFDPQGLVRSVNLPGAQLLGIERQRLLDKPMSRWIVDADGRKLFVKHCAEVLRREGDDCCEVWLQSSAGAKFFARLRSIAKDPVEGTHGVIRSMIIDVTEQVKLKTDLQDANDLLEQKVVERTQELLMANDHLVLEIGVRKDTEESLRMALKEVKQLKDRLEAENVYLQHEVARKFNFGEIIGQSSAISQVFDKVEQIALLNTTVLLQGETGTGKGVVARAIHARSSRKDRPMVTINCTALPANLIESELFGREKGAFTGASARQMGRFELADGGTIFLDEIGEMPMELQCKLLRVIQDGEFERLGSPRTIKVDVRIIAASNRKLEEEIKKGSFREDLYYRLNVFPITIPPLRARKEDIRMLVNFFVAKFNKKIGKNIETIPKESLEALENYDWPGNVRELESVVERATIISPGSSLRIHDQFNPALNASETPGVDLKGLADLERDHILHVLQKTNWRVEGKNGAAAILDINPSTLRARMRKFGVHRNNS
ncbi:MAG: sigma 54-interacting transcriptional regulator [Desulfomicrobium sp.]|nr:sigma 54-interacting transcriptional regulator [Pseudomonadota bacterium]MBV1711411.1 sigma 54-interacting transcriptional regulator [Desulfomicrobium sp.]MBU4570813.1 sigma 54-interacting transcriptional regulator [Pseudomonadota bacterium]MBU4595303.1 sigma 54-interacting transcriptional regulator [Pseudomonadota bacterium]MBV1720735.1 sigma 54-interacting transcriptional regulator [Desulfomicrobium sp.]